MRRAEGDAGEVHEGQRHERQVQQGVPAEQRVELRGRRQGLHEAAKPGSLF